MNGGQDAATEQWVPEGKQLGVAGRFLAYGLIGLGIECFFTSIADLATGAGGLQLKGYSYLWMHPIWALTLLLAEVLMTWLKRKGLSRVTRAFVAMAASFAIEYTAGALLVAIVGRCPWDYTGSPWSVHGLIRLDYAPLWFLCGWTCEPVTQFFRRIYIFSQEPEAVPGQVSSWSGRGAPPEAPSSPGEQGAYFAGERPREPSAP
jgi:hypothetical protein